jgi:hypothetical protein
MSGLLALSMNGPARRLVKDEDKGHKEGLGQLMPPRGADSLKEVFS